MPEKDIYMEEHWEEIQSEIASRGFVIFPDTITSTEHKAFWPTAGGVHKFLDLAHELERKVIYLHSSKFDSEDALDLLFLIAPDDLVDYNDETVRDCLRTLGVEGRGEAKEYLKTTKFYEGRRVDIRVEWVFDGIIHVYWKRPAWFADISKLAERIVDISESLAYE